MGEFTGGGADMILEGLEVGTCQGADLAVFVPGYLIIRLNARDVTSGL